MISLGKKIITIKRILQGKKEKEKGGHCCCRGGQIIGHLSRAGTAGKLGEGDLSGDRRLELRVIMSLREWMKSLPS